MAETPLVTLQFHSTGGNSDRDCGVREVMLPAPLPTIGDDFPWATRDFEGFRIAMLEELAARFPERTRWTPADLEVVLVEVLAWALDQLSDMLDRVTAEAYLETARRPESLRRLLKFIGYDAIAHAGEMAKIPNAVPTEKESLDEMRNRLKGFHSAFLLFFEDYRSITAVSNSLKQLQEFQHDPDQAKEPVLLDVQHFLELTPLFVEQARQHALHLYWDLQPASMNAARMAGPRAVHSQRRMVSITDYEQRMQEHPLVHRAIATVEWNGS